MSKSYWVVAVAFGLIAVSLQAQEQANDTQPAEQQRGQQAEALEPSVPVRIIESEESSRTRESRERESDQREKDDLIAQQRMADATEAMNEATQSMNRAAWLSTFFVAVGTGLLVWTLFLTRAANKAAQAAVDTTRQIGEAQTRAYLSFELLEYGHVIDPATKKNCVMLRPRIKNTGQTPAYLVATYNEVTIVDGLPSSIIVKAEKLRRSTLRIGAESSIFLAHRLVPLETIQSAVEANKYIVMTCGIDFLDVFHSDKDTPRKEDFAVRAAFTGDLIDSEGRPKPASSVEWHDLQITVEREY